MGDPITPDHSFTRPGQVAPGHATPDPCMQCGQPEAAHHGGNPWRLLVLDRDPQDPKWLFASVSMALDVRPAVLDSAGHYQDWGDVTRWVNRMFPGPVGLVPVHGALAWRIDEGGPR